MDAATQARHDTNRADLLAARATLEASWKTEDEARALWRAQELERFDNGLAAHDAMVANDGVKPLPKPPETPAVVPPKEGLMASMEHALGFGKPVTPPEPLPTAPLVPETPPLP